MAERLQIASELQGGGPGGRNRHTCETVVEEPGRISAVACLLEDLARSGNGRRFQKAQSDVWFKEWLLGDGEGEALMLVSVAARALRPPHLAAMRDFQDLPGR